MKYFSCQPDSHNGFGLLIGYTLTYFTVECTDQKETNHSKSCTTPNRKVEAQGGDGGATKVCVQHVVTLPHDFGVAPQCFGMANRSFYGFNMAFVGASSGVMAVVVMHSGSVLYAPGRTLSALRTHSVAGTANSTTSGEHRASQSVALCSPTSGVEVSLSLSLPDPMWKSSRSVGTITWMRDKPFVFVGFASGQVEWYQVTASTSKKQEHTTGGPALAAVERQCQMGAARDVRSSAAPKSSDATATLVTPFSLASGDSVPVPTNWGHGTCRKRDIEQQTYENSDGNSIRIRLHCCCAFPKTGAFTTSDWFPANGYVVAGAERAVYVFSSERPDCPLHCVPSIGCSFLACHPCLPFVSCLSFGRSAERDTSPDACVLHVLECTTAGSLGLAANGRTLEATPRHGVYYTCSWKFSLDMQVAVCNVKEGIVHVVHLARTDKSPDNRFLEDVAGQPSFSPLSSPPSLPGTTVVETGTTRTREAPSRTFYTCTRERELRLPLHSLVNVEFISAATHALPEMPPTWDSFSPPFAAAANDCFSPRNRSSVVLLEHVLAERMLHPSGSHNKGQRSTEKRDDVGMRTKTTVKSQHEASNANKANVVSHSGKRSCDGVCGDAVRAGAGAFSRIVGVNHAGELAVIPVDADGTLATLHPGCIAVGLCATVYVATVASTPVAAADGNSMGSRVEMIDMEQRMKERLSAGFGIPAAANVEALKAFSDLSSEADVRMLFVYIAMMEKVGVVGSFGPVPAITDLLSLSKAPTTTQLMDLKLLPHNAPVVCRSSTSQNDSRRLLLLHLLGWIPSQDSLALGGQCGLASEHLSSEVVERAVAMEVLHNRRPRAAAILLQKKHLNPTYVAVAGLIEHHDSASSTLRDCAAEVREGFLRQLSPWLRVAFLCGAEHSKIYTDTEIPIWDRIAIAAILEYDTPQLVSLIQGTFAEECNPVKRLLLLEGIRESTCQLMQVIVDCTGDFQLAACLFARIGACKSSTPTLITEKNVMRQTDSGSTSPPEVYISTNKNSTASHPWELWANAYRIFLNNEREFVKRAMFDLACQQLSELHVPHMKNSMGQQQQEPKDNASMSAPSWVSHCSSAEIVTSRTFPSTKVEGNLLPLLLLAPVERRCSVCSAPVYLRKQHARDIFAWCTACLHGGHANHLQEWFLMHPKCPVDGCGCHCDEDESVSWGEVGVTPL